MIEIRKDEVAGCVVNADDGSSWALPYHSFSAAEKASSSSEEALEIMAFFGEYTVRFVAAATSVQVLLAAFAENKLAILEADQNYSVGAVACFRQAT